MFGDWTLQNIKRLDIHWSPTPIEISLSIKSEGPSLGALRENFWGPKGGQGESQESSRRPTEEPQEPTERRNL